MAIPVPHWISEGWVDEKDGIKFWPMVLYPDIFHYLMFFPSELGSKDLSDYKNCKACSYFKSGWLEELWYDCIGASSKFCILKSQCKQSQNIGDTSHKICLVIEKKSDLMRSCHCTCMAGSSETCNHVAAAMFRVEAVVRNGLTNPACTCNSANQCLPTHQNVAPVKVKNTNFSREDFGQRGKKKRPLVSTLKNKFNPLVDNNQRLLTLTDIGKALEEVAP